MFIDAPKKSFRQEFSKFVGLIIARTDGMKRSLVFALAVFCLVEEVSFSQEAASLPTTPSRLEKKVTNEDPDATPARVTTVDPTVGYPPQVGGQGPRSSSAIAVGVQVPLRQGKSKSGKSDAALATERARLIHPAN